MNTAKKFGGTIHLTRNLRGLTKGNMSADELTQLRADNRELLGVLQWFQDQLADDSAIDMGKMLDELEQRARTAIAQCDRRCSMTPQKAYEKRYTGVDGGQHTWDAAPPHVKDLWLAAWTIAWAMGEQQGREDCAKLLEGTDLGGLKDTPQIQAWFASLLIGYTTAIRSFGAGDKA